MGRKEAGGNGRQTVDGRLVRELYDDGCLPPGLQIREKEWGWVVRRPEQREDDRRGDMSEWRVFEFLRASGRTWIDRDRVTWVGKNTADDSFGVDVKVGKCVLPFYRRLGIDGFVVQVKSSLTGAEDCLRWAEKQSIEGLSRTERRAGTKNGVDGGPKTRLDEAERLRLRYMTGYRYLAKEKMALVVVGDWPDDNISGQIVLQMMGMSGLLENDFLEAFYDFDPEMVEAYDRSKHILCDHLWGLSCRIWGEGNDRNGNGNGNGKGH